jgi:hypothetical protein
MLVTAFEVLAPFSAYIKALKIVVSYTWPTPQLPQLPQLDFQMLQRLYCDDIEGTCEDFMIHLLNTVQISGIPPPSYHLCVAPYVFPSLLRHSAVRNAVKLELRSRKVSVRGQYRLIDVLDRLQVR